MGLYKVVESVWHVVPQPMRMVVRNTPPLNAVKNLFRRALLGRHQYLYDEEYYNMVEEGARRSCDVMADSLVAALRPATAVDLGCGTGAFLEALKARGVAVAGLEYSEDGLRRAQARGLDARPFNIQQDSLPADLAGRAVATSFEVAEHLPEAFADRFLDTLCAASDTIVLSAATPGQGGNDHVNEQPHSYWIDKMRQRGYAFDEPLSLAWRAEWKEKGAGSCYSSNVMLFRRTSGR